MNGGHPDPENSAAVYGRIVETLHDVLRVVADEVVPLTHAVARGVVVRTPSLPLVRSLNHVRVTSSLSAADAQAIAEAHHGVSPFRRLMVEDGATARRLLGPMVAAGWQTEHDVVMVLAGVPDRVVDTSAVVEIDEDAMASLMRRWVAEERPEVGTDALDQIELGCRREAQTLEETSLGVRGGRQDDGAALAMTKVRHIGAVSWVEDVYTVPAARGRGYARMLVTEALRRARRRGSELTFIIADAEDWPQHLYHRLGFRAVGGGIIFQQPAP